MGQIEARVRASAIALAALALAGAAAPVFAQEPGYFYCYAPDPSSGRLYATGITFRLGVGSHVIPTGDYVLGVIGVANAGNPFQQKIHACLQYEVLPES